MTVSANSMNKVFLQTYLSNIGSENNAISNNSGIMEQEKFLQQFAFKMVLEQMMSSMGNSMMSDFISTALDGSNSLNLQSSLNMIGNFNSSMRHLDTASLSQTYYSPKSGSSFEGLGMVSSKYESNLNPGAIANNPGDYGGKSYGAWQFSSRTGSLNSFLSYLSGVNGNYHSTLIEARAKDGNSFGSHFDAAWTNIAKNDPSGFLELQHRYIEKAFYDKAVEGLKTRFGFDVNAKSDAMKESVWSTAVQHGVGGTLSIFSKLNLQNSDRDIINDLYNERQKVDIYFRSSSPQVRQSVYNRFTREKADMLNLLSSSGF
jgi:hypothetical protein